ncbi:MAG: hypothetical protein IT380_16130 [Myxococcales bacterium]|nr:hypothetical protein [Myxococcales bacterium]
MKTAISIPDAIFRRAERAARKLGITRSEFFSRAAERLLRSLDEASVTASYDAAFGEPESEVEKALRNEAARRALLSVDWDDA